MDLFSGSYSVGRREKMTSAVDLHMHSTASDGKDTPIVLWGKIKRLGIRCFSLTDHDTVDGAREMEKMVAGDGGTDTVFIRGIEFSCRTSVGKCHILGYAYDWNSDAFRNILRKGEELRRRKLEQRLDYLRKEFGFEFSGADVEKLRQMKSVGKPHLAELMVKCGYADSSGDAVKNYINSCPTLDSRIQADEVIRALRASGGISVWAHPYGGVGEPDFSGERFNAQLACLAEAGIQGLECYYSRYTGNQISQLTTTAGEKGLFISGGSDYHGRGEIPALGTLNADGFPVRPEQLSLLHSIKYDG